jgi:hypothetical protein
MPATRKQKRADAMRPTYDFSEGVRGKYATRFARASNVVVLAPDVAAAFKTSKAVNEALRSTMGRRPVRKARAASGRRA